VEKETSWSLIGGKGDKLVAHWWRRGRNGSLIGGEGDKRIAHWWRRGRNRSLIGDEIDLELMKEGVEAD